jgi:hypothetical protein
MGMVWVWVEIQRKMLGSGVKDAQVRLCHVHITTQHWFIQFLPSQFNSFYQDHLWQTGRCPGSHVLLETWWPAMVSEHTFETKLKL